MVFTTVFMPLRILHFIKWCIFFLKTGKIGSIKGFYGFKLLGKSSRGERKDCLVLMFIVMDKLYLCELATNNDLFICLTCVITQDASFRLMQVSYISRVSSLFSIQKSKNRLYRNLKKILEN